MNVMDSGVLQRYWYGIISNRVASSRYYTFANSIFLLISLGLLALVTASMDVESICTPKSTSTYSPIFDRLPIHFVKTTPDTTFWAHNAGSLYQQRPSPEVDRAWRRISDESGFRLTASEARKMGKDLDTLWPWPSEDQYSIEAGSSGESNVTYLAMIDVFHQIHCLDNMRRATWPEFYGDLRGAYKNHTFPFDDHLLHCQYILLQALTCHSDVEVYMFNKIRGFKGPFPDFEFQRQCRNFEDVLRWKEENQVNVTIDPSHTPIGIKELPAEGRAMPFSS